MTTRAYELVERVTSLRVLALVINLAAVALWVPETRLPSCDLLIFVE